MEAETLASVTAMRHGLLAVLVAMALVVVAAGMWGMGHEVAATDTGAATSCARIAGTEAFVRLGCSEAMNR